LPDLRIVARYLQNITLNSTCMLPPQVCQLKQIYSYTAWNKFVFTGISAKTAALRWQKPCAESFPFSRECN